MLTLLLLACAQQVGPSVSTGDHFAVTYENIEPDLASDALDIAEAAWPIARNLLGVAEPRLDLPLSIELQLDANSDPNLLKRFGLPLPTQAHVARDAARAVVRHFVANHNSHPAWLSDGMASWVERETLQKLKLVGAPMEEPLFSTTLLIGQRVAQGRRLPSMDAFLSGTFDGLAPREVTALNVLFFQRLAMDANRLETLLQATKQIAGGNDYLPALAGALQGIWGATKLWEDFEQSLSTSQPLWDELSGSLSTRNPKWLQRASSDEDAVAWRTQPFEAKTWELDGRFEVLARTGSDMSVLLDRTLYGHVTVTFRVGGEVAVTEYKAKTDRSTELVKREATVARETPSAFRIEWDGKRLTVQLQSQRVLHLALDRSMSGPWGLGIAAGGVGEWSGLEVR